MIDYAAEIRNLTAERLKGLSRYFPRGRLQGPATIRLTPVMPAQDRDLPCLCVYLLGKSMQAEGDANAGAPSFEDQVRIGISSILRGDDKADLDDRMAAAAHEILDTLLCDPVWLAEIEAVLSVDQQFKFDDQKYLAAIVATTITVTYRTDWPPRITDDLHRVTISTPDRTAAEINLPGETP